LNFGTVDGGQANWSAAIEDEFLSTLDEMLAFFFVVANLYES
jgi:hypothetical protein